MRTFCFGLIFLTVIGCGPAKGPIVADVGNPDDPKAKGGAPIVEEKSTLQLWITELIKPNTTSTKQLAAIDAIVKIDKLGDDVVTPLVEAIQFRNNAGAGQLFPNKPNSIQEAVVMTLVELGPKGEAALKQHALPLLTTELTDQDATVREHAAHTLRHLGEAAKSAQPALVKLFTDEDKYVREAAYSTLARIGYVPGLDVLKLLKHPDPEVQKRAVEALSVNIQRKLPVEALPILVELLRGNDLAMKRMAAESIGTMGADAAPAIPALVDRLKLSANDQLLINELSDVSEVVALSRIGKVAVPALEELLTEKNFLVRYQAAAALGGMGAEAKGALPALAELMNSEQESPDVLMEVCIAQVLIGADPKEPVNKLIELFDNPRLPAMMRPRVIRAFGRVGAKAELAVEQLVQAMKDPSPEIRKAVVLALKNMGSAVGKAVPSLGVMLSDEEQSLRSDAAEVLKGLGMLAKPAIADLAKAVNDSDDTVRRLAAESLAIFGPDAKLAVPELMKALVNKEYRSVDRAVVANTLAAIGPDAKAAVPSLIEALTTGDAYLKLAAAKAIGRVGPAAKEAVPKLIERMQKGLGGERNASMLALGLIGAEAKDAIEPLQAVFEKSTSEQKLWAAAALTKLTPKEAKPYLAYIVETLADPSMRPINVSMRNAAIDVLELVGPAASAAVPQLVTLTRDKKLDTRLAAIRGLGYASPDGKESVPVLVQLMNDKEIKIRRAAVQALGEMGPKASDATKRLKSLAASATELSEDAKRALERIEK